MNTEAGVEAGSGAEASGGKLANWANHVIHHHWRTLVLVVPFIWLLIFFLAPFFIVFKIAFAEAVIASPPYTPMIEWVDE
ncbi:MAG: putrescine ABC transporter permease PotH, partial [Gammaproteobacteria bacterium]|nr:putrescine ABC transporter permease PotH [Gammaproteobacteria bacterium]